MKPASNETEPQKLSEISEERSKDLIINNDAVTESEEPNKLLINKSAVYFGINKFILFEDVLENEDALDQYLSDVNSENSNSKNDDLTNVSNEIETPKEQNFNSHNVYAGYKVYESKPKILSKEDNDRIRGLHLLKMLPSDSSINLELNNNFPGSIKKNKNSVVSSNLTLSAPKKSIASSLKELSSSLKSKSLSSGYRSSNLDNHTLENQSLNCLSESSLTNQPNMLSKIKESDLVDPKRVFEKCFKVEPQSRKRNNELNKALFGNKSCKKPKVIHSIETEAMNTKDMKKGMKGIKTKTPEKVNLRYSENEDLIEKELRVELTDILINAEFKNLIKNKEMFPSDDSLTFNTVESPNINSKLKVSEKGDSFSTESKERKNETGSPDIKNFKKVKRKLIRKEKDLNQSLECIKIHESNMQETKPNDSKSDKNNNEAITNRSQSLSVNHSNIVSKTSDNSPIKSISKKSKSVKTNISTLKSDLSSSITCENALDKTSFKQSISDESKSLGPVLSENNNLPIKKFKTVGENCRKRNNELNFSSDDVSITLSKDLNQNNFGGSSGPNKCSSTSASQMQKPSPFMQMFSKYTEIKSEHSEERKFSTQEDFISFLSGSCKMSPKSPQTKKPFNEKSPSDIGGLFIPKKIHSRSSSENEVCLPDLKTLNEDRFIPKNKLPQSVSSPENSPCNLSFKKNNCNSLSVRPSNSISTSTGINDNLLLENVVVDEIESKSHDDKPIVESAKKKNKSLFKSCVNKISNSSTQQTDCTELSSANTDNSSISRKRKKLHLNPENDDEFIVKNDKIACLSPENAINYWEASDEVNSSLTDKDALEAELMLSDFSEANVNCSSFIEPHSGKKRSFGKSKVSALQLPDSVNFSKNGQLSKTKPKKKVSTKYGKLTKKSPMDMKHVDSSITSVISSVKMSDNNMHTSYLDDIEEELPQPYLSSDNSNTDIPCIDPVKTEKKLPVKIIARSQVLENSSFVSNSLSLPSTSAAKPLNKKILKMGKNLKTSSIKNKSGKKRKDNLSQSLYCSNKILKSDIDDELQNNSNKVSNTNILDEECSSETSICNSSFPKQKVKSKKPIKNSKDTFISIVKMSDENIHMSCDDIEQELQQPYLSSDNSNTDMPIKNPMKARKTKKLNCIAKSQILEHPCVSNSLSSPNTSAHKSLNKRVSKMGKNSKTHSIKKKFNVIKRKANTLSQSSFSSGRTGQSDIEDELQNNSPVNVSNAKFLEEYSSESSICNSPSPEQKVKSKKSILNSNNPVISSVKMSDNHIHISSVDGIENELSQPNLSSDHSNTDGPFTDPMKVGKKKKFAKSSAKSQVLEHLSFFSNSLSSSSSGTSLNKDVSKIGKNLKAYSMNNKSAIKKRNDNLLKKVRNTEFLEEKYSPESRTCNSLSTKRKVKSKKEDLSNFTSEAQKDILMQSSYSEHLPRKSIRLKKKAERLSQLSTSPDPSNITFESDSPNSLQNLVKPDPSPIKVAANNNSFNCDLNQALSSVPSTSHYNPPSNNNFLQYDPNQFIRVHSDCFYHPQTNRYFISVAQHPLIVNQPSASSVNQFNSYQMPQIQMSFQTQNFPNLMAPLNSSASQNFMLPMNQGNFLPQPPNLQYNNSFDTRVNSLSGLQLVPNGVPSSGNQIFNATQMGLNMPNIVGINTPTSVSNPATRRVNTQETVMKNYSKRTTNNIKLNHLSCSPSNVSNSVSLNANISSGNQSFNSAQMGLNMPNTADINISTSNTNPTEQNFQTRKRFIVNNTVCTLTNPPTINYPQKINVLAHPFNRNQNQNIKENNASNYVNQNFQSNGNNKKKKRKLKIVDRKAKQTQELIAVGNDPVPDIVNQTAVWDNIVHNVIELVCLRRMVIFSSSAFGDINFNEFVRVKDFYSDRAHLKLLRTIIIKDMPSHDVSHPVKYKFHKSFINLPIRQVLKNYVSFYLNHLYQTTDVTALTHLVYQKFSLKECLIFSKIVLKDDKRVICKSTLAKYFTFVAMLRIDDDFRRRMQLK